MHLDDWMPTIVFVLFFIAAAWAAALGVMAYREIRRRMELNRIREGRLRIAEGGIIVGRR